METSSFCAFAPANAHRSGSFCCGINQSLVWAKAAHVAHLLLPCCFGPSRVSSSSWDECGILAAGRMDTWNPWLPQMSASTLSEVTHRPLPPLRRSKGRRLLPVVLRVSKHNLFLCHAGSMERLHIFWDTITGESVKLVCIWLLVCSTSVGKAALLCWKPKFQMFSCWCFVNETEVWEPPRKSLSEPGMHLLVVMVAFPVMFLVSWCVHHVGGYFWPRRLCVVFLAPWPSTTCLWPEKSTALNSTGTRGLK